MVKAEPTVLLHWTMHTRPPKCGPLAVSARNHEDAQVITWKGDLMDMASLLLHSTVCRAPSHGLACRGAAVLSASPTFEALCDVRSRAGVGDTWSCLLFSPSLVL